ncbi:MAG: carbohydrate kinase [Chthoniobacteraceae bacterium]
MQTCASRILSCGEVLWDLFPEGARFGGAPANFACHAAILGGEVSMLSAVGNDARGDEALTILHGFGIDTSLVQRIADAPTGSVGVSVDAAGKPTFEIHTGSAWDRLAWTDTLETRIAELDAIYFGTLGQRGEKSRTTIRRALGLAKARGILRVLDVNLRKPFYDPALIRDCIAQASVLKLSDDELAEVAAACDVALDANPTTTLRALLNRFALDLVVMTRGAKGALLVSAEDSVDQPGIPTKVVDTVGAGDSFTAALVLGLLRGDAREVILRKACETASAVCAQSGAVPDPQSASR